jgi:hypothetical protein
MVHNNPIEDQGDFQDRRQPERHNNTRPASMGLRAKTYRTEIVPLLHSIQATLSSVVSQVTELALKVSILEKDDDRRNC